MTFKALSRDELLFFYFEISSEDDCPFHSSVGLEIVANNSVPCCYKSSHASYLLEMEYFNDSALAFILNDIRSSLVKAEASLEIQWKPAVQKLQILSVVFNKLSRIQWFLVWKKACCVTQWLPWQIAVVLLLTFRLEMSFGFKYRVTYIQRHPQSQYTTTHFGSMFDDVM